MEKNNNNKEGNTLYASSEDSQLIIYFPNSKTPTIVKV